jgi:PadR family transcriptional regulator, regulatory protein PadR
MWYCHRKVGVGDSKLDLLQGTLDLMVLHTLDAMGPQHGYGIARRIEQVSGNEVLLNQGTIYASLVRLEQRGWIESSWGVSGNNRKAKFYAITDSGRRQLAEDARYWARLTGVMDRVMAAGKPARADRDANGMLGANVSLSTDGDPA